MAWMHRDNLIVHSRAEIVCTEGNLRSVSALAISRKERTFGRHGRFSGVIPAIARNQLSMSGLACSCQRTMKTHRAEIGFWPVKSGCNSRQSIGGRAHAEFAQFGSSPNYGLQLANRGHGVPAHRSMCRKVGCYQRHCSQEHDDGNDGDWIVGADSVQQPGNETR